MAVDLFGAVPRKPSLIRMRAYDHGQAPYIMPGWKTSQGAAFKCWKCGFVQGWVFDLSVSEIKRGLPCPHCNEGQP